MESHIRSLSSESLCHYTAFDPILFISAILLTGYGWFCPSQAEASTLQPPSGVQTNDLMFEKALPRSRNLVQAPYTEATRIGLALGGGGTRGAAHVGVLKVLTEAGIPISCISGTSIGAIVGGLYSAGVPLSRLDTQIRSPDHLY